VAGSDSKVGRECNHLFTHGAVPAKRGLRSLPKNQDSILITPANVPYGTFAGASVARRGTQSGRVAFVAS